MLHVKADHSRVVNAALQLPLLIWYSQTLSHGFCAAEKSLVTVWSAPNYCYRCGNVASILCFDDQLEREVKYFTETEQNTTMMAPRNTVPYFL